MFRQFKQRRKAFYSVGFISFILFSAAFVSASATHTPSPAGRPQNNAASASMNSASTAQISSSLQAYESIFMFLLLGGLEEIPPPGSGNYLVGAELNSGHPVIQTLAEIIFRLLIPLYMLIILLTGVYYVFGSISPQYRATVKAQLMRLIIGLIACGMSLVFFDMLLNINLWMVQRILTVPLVDSLGNPITGVGYEWDPIGNFARNAGDGIALGGSLIGLIIIFTGGTGLGLILPIICGLIAMMLLPYLVLTIRWIAVLIFGALFPFTIFCQSFEFTKGLGTKLMKQTLTWIFMPIPMAVFIVLTVQITEGIDAGISGYVGNAIAGLAAFMLVGMSPMMVTSMLSVMGAGMISVGQTSDSTKLVFLGYTVQGSGGEAFTQSAYVSQRKGGLGQGGADTAADYKYGEMGKGAPRDASLNQPPAPYSEAGRKSYQPNMGNPPRQATIDGQARELGSGGAAPGTAFERGISAREKWARLRFGAGVNEGTKLEHLTKQQYWGLRYEMSKTGWEKAMYSALGLMTNISPRHLLVPAGIVLRGLLRRTIQDLPVGKSLAGIANKMTGYWEEDKATGQVAFNRGWHSIKGIRDDMARTAAGFYTKDKDGKATGAPGAVKAAISAASLAIPLAILATPFGAGMSVLAIAAGGAALGTMALAPHGRKLEGQDHTYRRMMDMNRQMDEHWAGQSEGKRKYYERNHGANAKEAAFKDNVWKQLTDEERGKFGWSPGTRETQGMKDRAFNESIWQQLSKDEKVAMALKFGGRRWAFATSNARDLDGMYSAMARNNPAMVDSIKAQTAAHYLTKMRDAAPKTDTSFHGQNEANRQSYFNDPAKGKQVTEAVANASKEVEKAKGAKTVAEKDMGSAEGDAMLASVGHTKASYLALDLTEQIKISDEWNAKTDPEKKAAGFDKSSYQSRIDTASASLETAQQQLKKAKADYDKESGGAADRHHAAKNLWSNLSIPEQNQNLGEAVWDSLDRGQRMAFMGQAQAELTAIASRRGFMGGTPVPPTNDEVMAHAKELSRKNTPLTKDIEDSAMSKAYRQNLDRGWDGLVSGKDHTPDKYQNFGRDAAAMMTTSSALTLSSAQQAMITNGQYDKFLGSLSQPDRQAFNQQVGKLSQETLIGKNHAANLKPEESWAHTAAAAESLHSAGVFNLNSEQQDLLKDFKGPMPLPFTSDPRERGRAEQGEKIKRERAYNKFMGSLSESQRSSIGGQAHRDIAAAIMSKPDARAIALDKAKQDRLGSHAEHLSRPAREVAAENNQVVQDKSISAHQVRQLDALGGTTRGIGMQKRLAVAASGGRTNEFKELSEAERASAGKILADSYKNPLDLEDTPGAARAVGTIEGTYAYGQQRFGVRSQLNKPENNFMEHTSAGGQRVISSLTDVGGGKHEAGRSFILEKDGTVYQADNAHGKNLKKCTEAEASAVFEWAEDHSSAKDFERSRLVGMATNQDPAGNVNLQHTDPTTGKLDYGYKIEKGQVVGYGGADDGKVITGAKEAAIRERMGDDVRKKPSAYRDVTPESFGRHQGTPDIDDKTYERILGTRSGLGTTLTPMGERIEGLNGRMADNRDEKRANHPEEEIQRDSLDFGHQVLSRLSDAQKKEFGWTPSNTQDLNQVYLNVFTHFAEKQKEVYKRK